VRGKRVAALYATGSVVMCRRTRNEGDQIIEAWQCLVSGYAPGVGPRAQADGVGVVR
jgi:hypothetical protein